MADLVYTGLEKEESSYHWFDKRKKHLFFCVSRYLSLSMYIALVDGKEKKLRGRIRFWSSNIFIL